MRYVVFNKPYGVVSQFSPPFVEPGKNESKWRTLGDFDFPPDIYPCGRLDADSEGLLLLTNDGRLINGMLDPEQGHRRIYWVQVEGTPAEEQLEQLRRGNILIGGGPGKKGGYATRPCETSLLAEDEGVLASPLARIWERTPPVRFRMSVPTTWLAMALTEGKNRQVRRMTAAVGLPTLRLIRMQLGVLSLKDLLPGQWEVVAPADVEQLLD